jgi:thiol-disulfide isomerase/thioredoxin
MRRIVVAFGLLMVGLTVGCLQPIYEPGAGSNVNPKSPVAPNAGSGLVVGDGQAMRDMIAAHKGKVVFVDYWATWCEPCVAAFPHTVELGRKHKDKEFAVIAVSFDELTDKEKVVKFLADQGADFENLLSSYDGVGTEAAKDFEVGEEKAVDLDQRIEELLAE